MMPAMEGPAATRQTKPKCESFQRLATCVFDSGSSAFGAQEAAMGTRVVTGKEHMLGSSGGISGTTALAKSKQATDGARESVKVDASASQPAPAEGTSPTPAAAAAVEVAAAPEPETVAPAVR